MFDFFAMNAHLIQVNPCSVKRMRERERNHCCFILKDCKNVCKQNIYIFLKLKGKWVFKKKFY